MLARGYADTGCFCPIETATGVGGWGEVKCHVVKNSEQETVFYPEKHILFLFNGQLVQHWADQLFPLCLFFWGGDCC